jgi:hypothetical protein
MFVAAMQRVLDELVAVFEQIGAELPACAREIMQGIQVKLAGKLPDYTVALTRLANHRGGARPFVGSGSRITAEGCREPINVRIRPLVCYFRMVLICRSQQLVQQWLHIRNAGC